MKNKPFLIRTCAAVCGTLFIAAGAHAQSSVTLYGLLDTGIEYVTHANAEGSGVARVPSITGELPSRWGLRGREDLGNGYAAEFQLENGFNVHAGNIGQGGRLFGRQAWVGIKSPYGLLSFGRQYTMTYWAMADADVLGPNIYGMASLDAYLANARSDNTIGYRGTLHGLTLGATWSFGRDAAGTGNSPAQGTCAGQVPGQMTQCRQWSAMLKYDTSSFGLAAAYDEQRGGTNAAADFYNGVAPFPLTSSVDKDARTQFNGYVKYGSVKVGAGYIGRRVTTEGGPDVRYDMYFVGGSWQATPAFSIDGEGIRIVNSAQDARASTAILRANYLLSKSTLVYLQGAYLTNSAKAAYSISAGGGGTTPAPGMNQAALMAGIQHRF